MPEPDLDQHGAVLALVRSPGGRTEKGECVIEGTSRREMLLAAAAVAVAPISAQTASLFFTPPELRMVDELSEIIIPADDHSPGARAAKVADQIDKSLAESFDAKPQEDWREGLQVVDTLCRQMHGTAFLQATPAQRVAVVARMRSTRATPKGRKRSSSTS